MRDELYNSACLLYPKHDLSACNCVEYTEFSPSFYNFHVSEVEHRKQSQMFGERWAAEIKLVCFYKSADSFHRLIQCACVCVCV